jgi:hypothetical protein
MPYVVDDQAKEKRAAPGLVTPNQASGLTVAGGNTAAPASGAVPQAPGSGRYVNFDRIFAANQGAANQMANGVGKDVQNQATQAQLGLYGQQNAFNNAVNQATNTYGGQQIAEQTSDRPQKDNGLQGAPTKGGGSYMTRDQAAAAAAKQYSAPTSLSAQDGYDAAYQQAQKADDTLALTKDPSGLQTYFQQKANAAGTQGNYTQGMSRLDAALTNQAGNQQFSNLRNKYGNFEQMFDAANAASKDQSDNAKAQSNAVSSAYGNLVSQFDKDEQTRKDAAAKYQQDQKLANESARHDSQAGRGDLDQTTVSLGDSDLAANDGLYAEWRAAGSPPYDEWKASRGQA